MNLRYTFLSHGLPGYAGMVFFMSAQFFVDRARGLMLGVGKMAAKIYNRLGNFNPVIRRGFDACEARFHQWSKKNKKFYGKQSS